MDLLREQREMRLDLDSSGGELLRGLFVDSLWDGCFSVMARS